MGVTVRPAEPEPNGAPAAATSRVFTIGHSDRAFADVVHLLRVNQVTVLVDVRAFPSSRIHPQWNQAAIIDALPGDLTYRWIRALGGRRHTPAGTPSPNGGGWRVKGFRDYADYMGTPRRSRPASRNCSACSRVMCRRSCAAKRSRGAATGG